MTEFNIVNMSILPKFIYQLSRTLIRERPSSHVDKNWQIDFKIYMKVLMILNSQNKRKQNRKSQSTWFQVLLCKDINQEM